MVTSAGRDLLVMVPVGVTLLAEDHRTFKGVLRSEMDAKFTTNLGYISVLWNHIHGMTSFTITTFVLGVTRGFVGDLVLSSRFCKSLLLFCRTVMVEFSIDSSMSFLSPSVKHGQFAA